LSNRYLTYYEPQWYNG